MVESFVDFRTGIHSIGLGYHDLTDAFKPENIKKEMVSCFKKWLSHVNE